MMSNPKRKAAVDSDVERECAKKKARAKVSKLALDNAQFTKHLYYGQSRSTRGSNPTASVPLYADTDAADAAIATVEQTKQSRPLVGTVEELVNALGAMREEKKGCPVECFRKLVEYGLFNSSSSLDEKSGSGGDNDVKMSGNAPGGTGLGIVDLIVLYALTFKVVQNVEFSPSHPAIDEASFVPTTVRLTRELHATDPRRDRTLFQIDHAIENSMFEVSIAETLRQSPYTSAIFGFCVDIPKSGDGSIGRMEQARETYLSRRGVNVYEPIEYFRSRPDTTLHLVEMDMGPYTDVDRGDGWDDVNWNVAQPTTVFDDMDQYWHLGRAMDSKPRSKDRVKHNRTTGVIRMHAAGLVLESLSLDVRTSCFE